VEGKGSACLNSGHVLPSKTCFQCLMQNGVNDRGSFTVRRRSQSAHSRIGKQLYEDLSGLLLVSHLSSFSGFDM